VLSTDRSGGLWREKSQSRSTTAILMSNWERNDKRISSEEKGKTVWTNAFGGANRLRLFPPQDRARPGLSSSSSRPCNELLIDYASAESPKYEAVQPPVIRLRDDHSPWKDGRPGVCAPHLWDPRMFCFPQSQERTDDLYYFRARFRDLLQDMSASGTDGQ
jgi:hypothetical protein